MGWERRNEDVHNKVYRYGARPPTVNGDLVRDQIKLASEYYNALVRVERDRRDRWDNILGLYPGVPGATRVAMVAQEVADDLEQELRDMRAKTYRRRPDPELSKAVRQAKVASTRRWTELEKLKRAAREVFQPGLDASNDRAQREKKGARADNGLYWGTGAVIDRSVPVGGKPPAFHKWEGSGQVAVQNQYGKRAESVYQLDDIEGWRSRRPGKILRIRIGSNPDRSPVWAEVPVLYHRPIPKESTVKWVQLVLKRVGRREEWSVSFTVETPGVIGKCEHGETCGGRVIAVDLGWRKTDHGLRAGYATDSDGYGYEIMVPQWLVDGWGVTRHLRSVRDRMFDEVRVELCAWERSRELPRWLAEKLSHVGQWKRQGRLVVVLGAWREARFDGDAAMFRSVAAWARQDGHLYDWERYQERRCLHQRRELYRHWASWMASSYDAVAFENLNIADLKKKKGIEEEEDGVVGDHTIAAPGSLRSTVEQACLFAGRRALRVKHAGTSETCAVCGAEEMYLTRSVKAECGACGVVVDRDCNASRIILARARGGAPRGTPGVLAVPKSNWYRRIMAKPVRIPGRSGRSWPKSGDRSQAGAQVIEIAVE